MFSEKAIILKHNSINQYDFFFWLKIAKCTQSFKRLNSKSAGKRLAVKGNRYVNFEPANNYSINDNGIFNCFYPHIIIYTLNNMLLNGKYDVFEMLAGDFVVFFFIRLRCSVWSCGCSITTHRSRFIIGLGFYTILSQ